MSTQAPTLPVAVAPLPALPAGVTTAIVINGGLRLPANLTTHDAFRKWARSEDCPEKVRFAYLAGVLWVDLSMEQLYTHNQVKERIGRGVGSLVEESRLGLYCPDGMLVSHPPSGLSTAPDGLFVSYDALQSGRVLQLANAKGVGTIELVGAPEMVLEVVSESSVEKDMTTLPELYHRAGVVEFWRVDAHGDLRFEIFRRTDPGYVPTQSPDGWWRSDTFARDFLLVPGTEPLGHPLFTLQVRPFPGP